MVERRQVWKCNVCGNIVEVLHGGDGTLVCCGKDMVLQIEHEVENEGNEKHVPVIEGKIVKVGSVEHPMTEEHYIEWIEGSSSTGEVAKIFLKPGENPMAEFGFEVASSRIYCNLHGLWKS